MVPERHSDGPLVSFADYQLAAQAAVEMAKIIVWREERSGSIGSQDHQRAKAIIKQYQLVNMPEKQ